MAKGGGQGQDGHENFYDIVLMCDESEIELARKFCEGVRRVDLGEGLNPTIALYDDLSMPGMSQVAIIDKAIKSSTFRFFFRSEEFFKDELRDFTAGVALFQAIEDAVTEQERATFVPVDVCNKKKISGKPSVNSLSGFKISSEGKFDEKILKKLLFQKKTTRRETEERETQNIPAVQEHPKQQACEVTASARLSTQELSSFLVKAESSMTQYSIPSNLSPNPGSAINEQSSLMPSTPSPNPGSAISERSILMPSSPICTAEMIDFSITLDENSKEMLFSGKYLGCNASGTRIKEFADNIHDIPCTQDKFYSSYDNNNVTSSVAHTFDSASYEGGVERSGNSSPVTCDIETLPVSIFTIASTSISSNECFLNGSENFQQSPSNAMEEFQRAPSRSMQVTTRSEVENTASSDSADLDNKRLHTLKACSSIATEINESSSSLQFPSQLQLTRKAPPLTSSITRHQMSAKTSCESHDVAPIPDVKFPKALNTSEDGASHCISSRQTLETPDVSQTKDKHEEPSFQTSESLMTGSSQNHVTVTNNSSLSSLPVENHSEISNANLPSHGLAEDSANETTFVTSLHQSHFGEGLDDRKNAQVTDSMSIECPQTLGYSVQVSDATSEECLKTVSSGVQDSSHYSTLEDETLDIQEQKQRLHLQPNTESRAALSTAM